MSKDSVNQDKQTERDEAIEQHNKDMISTFPQKTQKAMVVLINLLKKHPEVVSWDASGNMIFYNVPNTRGANIHDLLSFVLRPTVN